MVFILHKNTAKAKVNSPMSYQGVIRRGKQEVLSKRSGC